MARSGQDRTASDHEGQERQGHWTKTPNAVGLDRSLPLEARALSLILRIRAGSNGCCWESFAGLVRDTGKPKRKIALWLRLLESAGDQVIERTRGKVNRYYPQWPDESRRLAVLGRAAGLSLVSPKPSTSSPAELVVVPQEEPLPVPQGEQKQDSPEEDSREEEKSTRRLPHSVRLSETERRELSAALEATGLVSSDADEQKRRFGQIRALYGRWRDAGGSLGRFVVAKMERTTEEVRLYLATARHPWSYWLDHLRRLVETDLDHPVAHAPAAAVDSPASACLPTLAPTAPADVAPTPDDPEPFREDNREDDADADGNPDDWPAEDVEPGASKAGPTDRESPETLEPATRPPAGPGSSQISELDGLAGALRPYSYVWPVARAKLMRERTAARRIIEGGWTLPEIVTTAREIVIEGCHEVTFQEILWRLSDQQQGLSAALESSPSNLVGGPLAPSSTSIDSAAASAIDK